MLQITTLQKTVGKSVSCVGLGLHGGEAVEMKLHPGGVGHGLAFVRPTSGKNGCIPATWRNVRKNRLHTVLGNEDGVEISTVEHVLAALAGFGIDNALIELSAAEVPVMDGSASAFCGMIQRAGTVLQNEPAEFLDLRLMTNASRRASVGDSKMSIRPAEGLTISYTIDFANPAIGNQSFVYRHKSADGFAAEIAPARTFCLEEDIPQMRRDGFAVGGSLENAVVFGDGVLNPKGLRFANEPVRHKVLDCLGDLALAGKRIRGEVSVVRGGHRTHISFLRNLVGGGREKLAVAV